MPNKERANKWLDIVNEDLSVAEVLYKSGHWLYVGFMCHQVIEKHSKPTGVYVATMTHHISTTTNALQKDAASIQR